MLQRTPSGLQALGVLVLTGWVGAYLVLSSEEPPRGGDITWALVLALGLLVIGAVLGSRPVRIRIPFLRPLTYELAGIVSRWHEMTQRIETNVDRDAQLPESIYIDLIRLDSDTDRVIAKHFSDWRPFYEHNLHPFTHDDTAKATLQAIEFRHYKLFWHLDSLHGGQDRGVV